MAAAAMTDDARVSKFNALCGIQQQPAPADPIDNHLIRIDGGKDASVK